MSMNKATLSQILTLSTTSFLLRGIGMCFQVYLGRQIGASGLGLNQLVMSVYMFLSLLCTQTLSSAVLRLCAENPRSAKAVAAAGALLSSLFGVFGAGFLFFGSAPLSQGLGNGDISLPLRLLSPALPLVGASACLNAYLLSRGETLRAAMCQITEQLARSLLAVFLIETSPDTTPLALCCRQMTAISVGEGVSLATYLLIYLFSPSDQAPLQRDAVRSLFRIGIPILLATLVQSGMHACENLLIPTLLQLSGSARALDEYGLLGGMVLPVLLFPSVIPMAILTVQLPGAVRLRADRDLVHLRGHLRSTLGASVCFSFLCSSLFCGCAFPLMRLLYNNEEAAALLLLLAPLLPLLYLDRQADGLLKSLGRQRSVLILEIIESSVRLALLLLFAPRFGLRGVIAMMAISTVIGCLARMRCLLQACGSGRAAFTRALLHTSPALPAAILSLVPQLLFCALPLSDSVRITLGTCACVLAYFLFFFPLRSLIRRRVFAQGSPS